MKMAFGSRLMVVTMALAVITTLSSCGTNQQDIDLERQMHDEPAGEASLDAKNILQAELQKDSNKKSVEFDIKQYPNLDPNGYVPKYLLNDAMNFFNRYRNQFKNQNYIAMIDFRQNSSNRRLYIMNLNTGEVTGYLVAHGKNSDSNNDGLATQFSNSNGSLMSSVGAYMTAETYSGKHGFSLRLDGLQPTNSNARERALVIHPADYIGGGLSRQGRSFGCPALEPKYSRDVILKLKDGALLFAGY